MGYKYRSTGYFSGGLSGWSESHVFDRNETDPGAVASLLVPLWQQRAKLLGVGYQIDAFTVRQQQTPSGNPIKGVGFLVTPPQPYKPNHNFDGDPAFVAARIQVTNPTGDQRAFYYFGGPPDACTTNDGQFDSGQANFLGNFTSWLSLYLGAVGGWFSLVNINDVAITTYTRTDGFADTFTVAGAPFTPFAAGTLLPARIRRLNTRSNLNGAQRIIVLTNSTFALADATATGPFVSQGFLKVKSDIPVFVPAGGANIINRAAKHKRGRPFSATRGRAPVRPRF